MSPAQAAVKALLVKDGKFIVVLQHASGKRYWDFPGGRVEYGESPEVALIREVKEELTLDVTIGKLLGTWWGKFEDVKRGTVFLLYRCEVEGGEVDITKSPDPNDGIEEYKWVTKGEFLKDEYNVLHPSFKELLKKLVI